MNEDDIADKMISAWNDPFATGSDPRFLLIQGAREIRTLRREVTACRAVIRTLHEISEEMAQELRKRQPDPNAPVYLAGLFLVGVVMAIAWMLVGK